MMSDIAPDQIIARILTRFPGTVVTEAWGETSLFYNPGRQLPRGTYFATLKQKDGENDRASKLNRPGVYRLNIGTSRSLFFERFGTPPDRPGKGQIIKGPWDFTRLDAVTPHPVYGWMSWISVLNPSERTLSSMDKMIQAAFEKAKSSFEKKIATSHAR